MPYFDVQKFTAPGPASAHAMMLLWDHMMGRLLPGRLDREQMRDYYVRNRVLWGRGDDTDVLLSKCLELDHSLYPDSLWLRLYAETYLQLHPGVHAALWAPYADSSGQLPQENLGAHILSRADHTWLERLALGKSNFLFNTLHNGTLRYNTANLEMACAKPCWVDLDRDDQVHGAEGPAKVWLDGTAAYYWRGLNAPVAWFPQPTLSWVEARPHLPTLIPRVTPYQLPSPRQALQNSNVEQRRVAVEMIGWDAIIKGLRAVVIDEDPDPQVGTLLRVTIPPPPEWVAAPSEQQMFLRVQCGTGRTFALAVPPEMKTARQANAWTYGLDPEDYAPEVRT